MSLYDALGVEPDASDAEIKAAHRQAVKRTHPDAGGKREDFDRVQTAFNILSDRRSRDRYDKTGAEKTVDPAALLRAQGMEIVAGKMNELMSDPKVDPRHFDVVLGIRELIGVQRQNVLMMIEQSRAMQLRLRQFAKRFKRKKKTADGQDPLVGMLEAQVAGHEERIMALEGELKMLTTATELVEEYVYQTDPAQQTVYIQGLYQGATSGFPPGFMR